MTSVPTMSDHSCFRGNGREVWARTWASRSNLYNLSHLTNNAKYTTSHINGLVLGGAYAFSNQASRTGGAGFANDRAYTFGARYQNGPLVAAALYLEVNQPTAGNTEGNEQSGAGAGDYVNLRNIFSGPVVRQQAVAGGANYTTRVFHRPDWLIAGSSFPMPTALRSGCRATRRMAAIGLRVNGRPASHSFTWTDMRTEATALASSRSEARPKWEGINLGLITRCRNALACMGFRVAKGNWGCDASRYLQLGSPLRSTDRSQLGAAFEMRTRF